MIDPHGTEWLTVAEAAGRVHVRPQTIYVWAHRRVVEAHKIRRTLYVNFPDVARAERAWRQSGRIRGPRTARRIADTTNAL